MWLRMTKPKQICLVIEHRGELWVEKKFNQIGINVFLGHNNSDILLLQLAFCLQKSANEHPDLLNFHNGSRAMKLARLQGLDFLVF